MFTHRILFIYILMCNLNMCERDRVVFCRVINNKHIISETNFAGKYKSKFGYRLLEYNDSSMIHLDIAHRMFFV